MNNKTKLPLFASIAVAILILSGCATSPETIARNNMSFFVSSTGSGKGADLGGLSGADNLCQSLANSAGAGNRTWHAYLSNNASTTVAPIHARDRIGNGPWQNLNGDLIAINIDELHSYNNITKQTAITEKGEMVNGRVDKPNWHDVLTGSQSDGRAFFGQDLTCGNWTQSGEGTAMVGHHDRLGLKDDTPAKSWNSSHPSRGCSLPALASSGGDGRLYCFAVN